MNVGNLLNNSASKYPEKTAIISDFFRADGPIGPSMREQTGWPVPCMDAGLKKGDRIAILLHNCIYFVEAYFAAVKIGLVV